MKDISKKIFWLIIFSLIFIRVIMVILLMHDIPHTGVKMGGWWFHYGGDETAYFELAKSFADFSPINTKQPITVGFPLYLVPFISIFRASEISDILKPVFIFHAFLFYSLAIILTAKITEKILKSKFLGTIAATIFTVFPYIFYFLFKNIGPTYNGLTSNVFNFEHLMWVHVLTDPLSAFLVYLSFYLFLIILEKEGSDNFLPILLGIISGFATLIRITNVLIVLAFVSILIMQKKLKMASLVSIFSFLAFLPQLIYNSFFYGSPLSFKNLSIYASPLVLEEKTIDFKSIAQPGFSINNYYYFLSLADKYIPALEFVLVFLITLFVFGFVFLYKKNKMGLVVILLWLLPHLALYGTFASAARNIRYHFPVLPPLIILGISSILFIFLLLKQLTTYLKRRRLVIVK